MAKKKIIKVDEIAKEELELMSYKEITNLLLAEKGKMNTADLFKEIVRLLGLPKSTFEKQIGDYYTTLSTDKGFVLLEDGCWDLRTNHSSDKVIKVKEEVEDEEEEEEEEVVEEEEDTDNYDEQNDDDNFDDSDDDLKDLVVVDEEELELEE